MDTNKLKKFAVEAHNRIKTGVMTKLFTLGFDRDGKVATDSMHPQKIEGGSLWNSRIMPESFYDLWMSLYNALEKHGINDVCEEAAYTWFNRLVAIRILQRNDLIEPVLAYSQDGRTPRIVDEARMNRFPAMQDKDMSRLKALMEDDTKTTEQFAMLITAWCHSNKIINAAFGRATDYTELLLPGDILSPGGFIDCLNNTDYITDSDYKSSELIGWLYQFYNSERKDEVFAKKGKYAPDEIAPATQIFTPHWIVRYMVENTIGRIYLDNHPEAADKFKPKWKYLVDQEQRDDEHIYHFDELTDLRFADLSCGSGHILVYIFDLLFDIYLYEGYTRKEAVENILHYNITGVDIDLRAKQLATFALLLKACQKDETFKNGEVLPNVLTMPEPIPESDRHQLFHDFFKGEENKNILAELDDTFDLLEDAQTLGSIMKFNLSNTTLLAIRQTMEYWEGQSIVPDSVKQLVPSFRIILALTEKYTALVMNPPYMGSSRFDSVLSKYVKDNYAEGKADLFSVFMLVAKDRLAENGKYAMINMQNWMFLSSFENLRNAIIDNMQIDSILHLGPHTFDELGGEVVQNTSFVVTNQQPNVDSTFYRLVDGKNCKNKEIIFLQNIASNHFNNKKIRFNKTNQKDFKKIPGSPFGYWVSENVLYLFVHNNTLSSRYNAVQGLATANNDRFIRTWAEVSFHNIGLGLANSQEALLTKNKWFPCNKGGGQRKWYGSQSEVINWENDGYEIKNFKDAKGKLLSRPQNLEYNFMPSVSWNMISSGNMSFRYFPKGFIINNATNCIPSNDNLLPLLGYLSSKLAKEIGDIINPTVNLSNGIVGKFPDLEIEKDDYCKIVEDNVIISKLDWDAHETSWDFVENPLVAIMKSATAQPQGGNGVEAVHQRREGDATTALSDDYQSVEGSLPKRGSDVSKSWYDDNQGVVASLQDLCHPTDDVQLHGSTLETAVKAFEKLWTARFYQLHYNEEELNRQFIDIYGLQDELTPDVPLDEITILQQGEISIEDDELPSNAENKMS